MNWKQFRLKALYHFHKNNILIRNVFDRKHQKKALISYIIYPFIYGINKSHTNILECYLIAETFDKLGYTVDIIFYNSPRLVDFNEYDVLFGFGRNLENCLLHRTSSSPKVILYSTGSHPFYSNTVSLQRMMEVHDKTGVWMPESTRVLSQLFPYQFCYSDLIILKGNEAIKATYKPFASAPVELVRTFVHFEHDMDIEAKNFTSARKNYLWFGSTGAIHKGLDLVLEEFRGRQLQLHVCGPLHKEKNFYNYYKDDLEKSANVSFHGFLELGSEKFRRLMNECAFIIFPSSSEANCASVVTTMANGGLIPIVTRTTGIDVENFGIMIEGISREQIGKSIEQSQSYTDAELKEMSRRSYNDARSGNSKEAYIKRLTEILTKELH